MLGDLPQGWLRATLGQIGSWSGGGTPPKSSAAYWTNGAIPWVSPKDMKRPWIDSAIDHITEQAREDFGLKLVPKGSILFVTRSMILARTLPIAATAVPVAVNQDIKALTPIEDVDATFLLLQLSSLRGELLRSTVKPGTTVRSVNFEALKRFEVILPPLAEQKAIANRLIRLQGAMENARAQLLSVPALLDTYRRSLVIRALSGQLTETWRKINAPPPARDVLLSEIADIQSGVTLGKRYRAVELVERPYLRVANVQRGRLDLEDVRRISIPLAEAERHRLATGDILMNEGGDRDKLGRGSVWSGEIPDCVHQNHIFRVRLKDKEFPPEYVSLYSNELGQSYFFMGGTQTTNLASISKAKLGSLPLRLPHAEEAREILRVLTARTRWTIALRQRVDSALGALDALERVTAREAFEGRLVARIHSESPPSLLPISLEGVSNAARRPRTSRLGRNLAMQKLKEALEHWPAEGLTFDELRNRIPSDYETLKDAVFNNLAGAEPQLQQRYNDEQKTMRFFRREP